MFSYWAIIETGTFISTCFLNIFKFLLVCREEIEKQRAHESYMRLQEQGKTDQSKKDLGTNCLFKFASSTSFYLFFPVRLTLSHT